MGWCCRVPNIQSGVQIKMKKKSNKIEHKCKELVDSFLKNASFGERPLVVVSNSARSYAMVMNHFPHHPNVMSETFGIVL